jgi:TRAP-type C4-dicarboxylate transport system substrate-binding protein
VNVNGIRGIAVVALVALAAGAGCSGGDKAGGSGGVVTLRLATDDQPPLGSTPQIEEFARQVRRLSDGRMRIHVGWQANGSGPRHPKAFDQKTARKVMDGRYELGLVPARAWDVLGVTSLEALQAPFLVDSDALLDKVTADRALDDRMLAGLSRVRVVGLALLPETLRHPAGFGRPVRSLSDFSGAGVSAPRSAVTWEVIRALGAHPFDFSGDERGPLIDSGKLDASETDIGRAQNLPRPGIVTANVTFFPRVNALVANEDAFGRLTNEQKETLLKAAAATLAHVRATRPTDAKSAREACAAGVRVVLASDADIRGLVRATRPVVARLERDEETRKSIERIAALREALPSSRPAIAPCRGASAAKAAAKPGGRQAALPPDGVYRSLISPDEFLRAGIDDATARNNSGLFTLTLRSGRVSWTIKGDPTVCAGRYFRSHGTVRYVMDDPSPCGSGPGNWIFSARWRQEDGGIRFTNVQGVDSPKGFLHIAWGRLWRRIG